MTGEGGPTGSSSSTVSALLERMTAQDRKQFFLSLSHASQQDFRARLAKERSWESAQVDAYFGIAPPQAPPPPPPAPERAKGRPKVDSRGPWGQNRLEWYRTHHAELTRSQLKDANRPLYEDLTAHGELDEVPRKQAFNGDPLAYYREHHAGETRGEMQVRNPTLYQALLRRDLLGEIPLKKPYGDDPLAYYDQNFEGVTRGQLAERDPAFYNYLYRRNLHLEIPLQGVRPKRGSYKSAGKEGVTESLPQKPREPRAAPFKVMTGETQAAIEYWDTSMANPRMVLQPVTARKYLELYRSGLLRFQREGAQAPESYPTVEEAEAALPKRS